MVNGPIDPAITIITEGTMNTDQVLEKDRTKTRRRSEDLIGIDLLAGVGSPSRCPARGDRSETSLTPETGHTEGDSHLGIEEDTDIGHRQDRSHPNGDDMGVIGIVIGDLPNLFVQRCLAYNVSCMYTVCIRSRKSHHEAHSSQPPLSFANLDTRMYHIFLTHSDDRKSFCHHHIPSVKPTKEASANC